MMSGLGTRQKKFLQGALALLFLALLALIINEFVGQSYLYNSGVPDNSRFAQDMDTLRNILAKDSNTKSSSSRRQGIPVKANAIPHVLRPVSKGTHRKVKDQGASPVFSELSAMGRSNQSINAGLPELIAVDYIPITIQPNMNYVQIQDAMITLSLQRQIICNNWEMYGLKTDGGWPVCKAKTITPRTPCTVYSFGINYDWSFDDTYRDRHGCTIRTFDPSMKNAKDHEHSPGVFFYKLGLSSVQRRPFLGWSTDTLGGILRHFNEDNITIPYLKFDVDGYEWVVLAQMLADGVLKNVVQLSFELHIYYPDQTKDYFELMKGVEALGFRRWFYHHRLNGASYQCDQSFININFIKGYDKIN